MTETTTGNNQRSHVASGHVPFVPSAIGSESTTASLVPATQQPTLKGSSNAEQEIKKGVWKGSDEDGKDDQKMGVLLA